MKRILIPLALVLSVAAPAKAQSFGDFFKNMLGKSETKKTEDTKKTSDTTSKVVTALSQSDAEKGLKEALVIGAQAVSQQLSAKDGYFGDKQIQIPLPGQLGKLQKQLSKVGMSGSLDDLQLRVNRAAEAAAPDAANLVIDAVKNISIQDALSLVKGGDSAATDYLRLKTNEKLEGLLRPHIETALKDAGALNAVDTLSGKYNLTQFNIDPRKDIVDHSVDKALDGLFFYLAKEEKDIRDNPVERTTDILRKVFGG